MLVGVAGGIAFPILPLVGIHAGLSLPFIGLIMAANRLTRVFASPVVGMLADRVGGRRLLILGLASQIVVMALYWAGVTVHRPGLFFLLARLLHGPGSACVFVAAQVLALQAGGRTQGGSSVGVVRGAMMVGMPVGLVIGGLLAGRWGERVTFEAAIVAVVLATIAAVLTVPDLRTKTTSLPDLRTTLRGLTDRRLLALGVLNLAVFFSAQGTVLTTIVLLLRARGMTMHALGNQGTASLAMGVVVLVAGAATVAAGWLGDRYRAHAWIATVGLGLLIAGLLMTGYATSGAVFGLAMALVGIGMGGTSPALVALVSGFVDPERRGGAVGVIQLLGDVGGTLGPIVGATLFAYSYSAPFLASAVLCVGVVPVGLWLVRVENRSWLPSNRGVP